jgi:t-SNARE complex subunit (syntaxin)
MRNAALILLAAIAVFFAGFAAGISHSGTAALKSEVKAAAVVQKTDAVHVAQAQAKSTAIETKVEHTAAAIDTNKAAIKQRVTASVKRQAAAINPVPTETPHDETISAGLGCGFYLDVGTVRLLNASRAGTALDSAGSGDEARDAAPALCFTDFVDADQDLTRLYLDLSERHDALVDSVEQFQSEQRSRLGIKEPASND